MTEKSIYIGVENEFQLMRGREYQNFGLVMENLLHNYNAPYFARSNFAIRTKSGSALYADGNEPEVCSAPVRICPGFVQQAADSLYLARKELVDLISSDSELNLIGYTNHWNITRVLENIPRAEVMRALAVPYALLTLTPLSVGINLREKEDPHPGRLELLGDYIEDEKQIQAFLLFYAGTILNFKANADRLPFYLAAESANGDARYDNPILNGRYSKIEIKTAGSNTFQEISAQTYLELYYELFKEGIAQVGTPNNVAILEDFIYGRQTLEIDKFKKYAFAYQLKGNESQSLALRYHPALCVDKNMYVEDKPQPTALVAFLGSLANTHGKKGKYPLFPRKTTKLDWGYIGLGDDNEGYYSILGMEDMELFAQFVALKDTPEKKLEAFDALYKILAGLPLNDLYQMLQSRSYEYGINSLMGTMNPNTIRALLQTHADELQLAFDRCQGMHLGDIVGPKIDLQARISELEAKVGQYDASQDTSFAENTEILIEKKEKPKERKFNFGRVWRESELSNELMEMIPLLFLGGCLVGAVGGAGKSCIDSEEPELVKPVDVYNNVCEDVEIYATCQLPEEEVK